MWRNCGSDSLRNLPVNLSSKWQGQYSKTSLPGSKAPGLKPICYINATTVSDISLEISTLHMNN